MISYGRIYLRAVEDRDLNVLQEWRNIETYREKFREFRELSMRHQKDWYEKVCRAESKDYMFAVCDAGNGDLIGAAGLCYINWVYRNADLSFYIGKDQLYADFEFAQDTVRALLSYGFEQLNLKRIWCELYEGDLKKRTLLSQMGFIHEGTLRSNAFKNGKYVNGMIFAMLDDDYNISLQKEK